MAYHQSCTSVASRSSASGHICTVHHRVVGSRVGGHRRRSPTAVATETSECAGGIELGPSCWSPCSKGQPFLGVEGHGTMHAGYRGLHTARAVSAQLCSHATQSADEKSHRKQRVEEALLIEHSPCDAGTARDLIHQAHSGAHQSMHSHLRIAACQPLCMYFCKQAIYRHVLPSMYLLCRVTSDSQLLQPAEHSVRQ